MNHRGSVVSAGRRFSRAGVIRFLLILLAGVGANGVAAMKTVPAEFQGKWVPSKATCESAVVVLVAADRLTLVNGTDREALGGIEMADSGYFPRDYSGIMAVLITESDGQQPVTATFNLGEKKGAAQLDFAPVIPGKPTAQSSAYNARITKLNLAKRFPLNKVALKKCAGG